MDSSLKVVLKFVVILFAFVSTLVGGVQGNEIVQWDEKKVCMPYLPCYRASPCCPSPPPRKVTNP
ncbi:transmembrane protein, putative [Medicago truncatula]|uniref:Transmembrane protein, putative n=1 Tax=Medicago truncatula TaxID=3880 RepID=G7KK11_MEDTR|nr:transmembrane protein, putative [Medicago truncatula]